MKPFVLLSVLLFSTVTYVQPVENKAVDNDFVSSDIWPEPYTFALRTSFLFDILLIPTVGAEWRMNSDYGLKLDAGFSAWGSNTGSSVQKVWFMRPEVRRYMTKKRNLYVGASTNVGNYNIYKGMLGSIFSDDTGYDGKFFNVGLCAGYQWHLSRKIALDFNLGMGYNRFEYDSFNLIDRTRIYKEKDKVNEFFGPTQICISLVWKITGVK